MALIVSLSLKELRLQLQQTAAYGYFSHFGACSAFILDFGVRRLPLLKGRLAKRRNDEDDHQIKSFGHDPEHYRGSSHRNIVI